MRKKHRLKFIKFVVQAGIWSTIGITTLAQAQEGDLVTAINRLRASIDALVKTAATYIFQTPPNIGNTLVTGVAASSTVASTVSSIKTLNDSDIMMGIVPNRETISASLTQLATVQASDTILPQSGLGNVPLPFFSSSIQSNIQAALAQGNANFDFQSLITPLTYTKDQQNYALNFIKFIGGHAFPISSLSLKNEYPDLDTKDKIDIQRDADYQTFQVQRRQIVAAQSAILSNLYYLYSKRLPITSIKAGDTALNIENPSAHQIEDYIATWRTSSPNWYAQMSTAAPTNVAREALFILAEVQTELHRIHLENERIITLLAINQLINFQNSKALLSQSETNIRNKINAKIHEKLERKEGTPAG
jgi:hypothetical protein